MSFFRDNSLRSIEDGPLDGQINESIWNNWDMGMRNQPDFHQPPTCATVSNDSNDACSAAAPFSAKAFDWEASANNVKPHLETISAAPVPQWNADVKAPVESMPTIERPPVAYIQETSNKRRKIRTASNSKKSLVPLPVDFEPLPYSVLCGQGNEYFNAVGKPKPQLD